MGKKKFLCWYCYQYVSVTVDNMSAFMLCPFFDSLKYMKWQVLIANADMLIHD